MDGTKSETGDVLGNDPMRDVEDPDVICANCYAAISSRYSRCPFCGKDWMNYEQPLHRHLPAHPAWAGVPNIRPADGLYDRGRLGHAEVGGEAGGVNGGEI